MEKPTLTFYEFMQQYPHEQPYRQQLARHLKQLAKRHTEVKRIDSFMDLMMVSTYMLDRDAFRAVSGDLWCTYCAACNHPF